MNVLTYQNHSDLHWLTCLWHFPSKMFNKYVANVNRDCIPGLLYIHYRLTSHQPFKSLFVLQLRNFYHPKNSKLLTIQIYADGNLLKDSRCSINMQRKQIETISPPLYTEQVKPPSLIQVRILCYIYLTFFISGIKKLFRFTPTVTFGDITSYSVDWICSVFILRLYHLLGTLCRITLKEPGFLDPSHSREGADSSPQHLGKPIYKTSSVWY